MVRPTVPRPKRGGEEFARTLLNESETFSKKPRFDVRNPSALAPDAPEEDAVLEADEIGKRGVQTKRNAVNIDGYESDSSNEGFNARAELKAKSTKNGQSKDEEDNDMFADLEEEQFRDGDADEDEVADGKRKKKNVKFVDVDQIEGQIADSKSGGHVSANLLLNDRGKGKRIEDNEVESSSDSEVGDEARAEIGSDIDEELGAGAKKKHAPKLDAFNLRNEKEEGGFDESLNYVRKAADPDAVHDTWLQGLSKKDMKKAKEAQDKRDLQARKKAREEDSVLTSEVLKILIPYLEKGETILEALGRVGKVKQKKKPKWQNKNKSRRKNEMEVDEEAGAENPAETERRKTVEAITEAADRLLTRGQAEIYDAAREALVRQYQRETGEVWVDSISKATASAGPKMWQYRWSDARDGGDIHGPYEGTMMVAWQEAGYFGEGVEFKRTDDESGEWSRWVEFI
jgi:CD2 antigen cytoplasmic tail-binding protein 2